MTTKWVSLAAVQPSPEMVAWFTRGRSATIRSAPIVAIALGDDDGKPVLGHVVTGADGVRIGELDVGFLGVGRPRGYDMPPDHVFDVWKQRRAKADAKADGKTEATQ